MRGKLCLAFSFIILHVFSPVILTEDNPNTTDDNSFTCTFDDVSDPSKSKGLFCPGMEQDKTDDFNWKVKCEKSKLKTSRTDSPHSGFRSRCYMYIFPYEPMYKTYLTKRVMSVFQKARIFLPPVTEDGEYSLDFRYHMHGDDMGTLKILVKPAEGKLKSLWMVEGEQNKLRRWKYNFMTMQLNAGDQVVIVGITSDTCCQGMIALDNINLKPYVAKEDSDNDIDDDDDDENDTKENIEDDADLVKQEEKANAETSEKVQNNKSQRLRNKNKNRKNKKNRVKPSQKQIENNSLLRLLSG